MMLQYDRPAGSAAAFPALAAVARQGAIRALSAEYMAEAAAGDQLEVKIGASAPGGGVLDFYIYKRSGGGGGGTEGDDELIGRGRIACGEEQEAGAGAAKL